MPIDRPSHLSGSFVRALTLPEGVDPDGVQAHFDRGVLEIRIPKPEQKKPRQVQITLGTRPHDTKTIESADSGDPQANSRDLGPGTRLIPNCHQRILQRTVVDRGQ